MTHWRERFCVIARSASDEAIHVRSVATKLDCFASARNDGIGCRALLQNTSTSETSDPKYISPLLRGAESAVIAVRSASDEAIHVRSVGTRLDCLRSLSSGGTSCRPGGSHDGTGIQADTSAVSCGARLRYRNGSRLAAGCDSAHFIGVAPPDLP